MNPTSRPTWSLSLLLAAALGAAATWYFATRSKPPALPLAPMISLEKMGHLASLKVHYADVIEFTEKRSQEIPWTQWELRFGGTKVLLVARGDCTVATDLRNAKLEAMKPDDRTVTVSLPAPTTIVARVNHQPREQGGSYFYAITNEGLEPIIPDSSNRIRAVNTALALAEREVARACSVSDVVDTAKRNAEEVLAATFHAIGWKARFAWRPA